METQTSFVNNNGYSNKVLKPYSPKNNDFSISSNNNNNNGGNVRVNPNDRGYNYDSESARLIPHDGSSFTDGSNGEKKKKVYAQAFILLCLLICIGLALMGLFHYLITNDKRIDSISILFWAGSSFLFLVLIICFMAKKCGE